MKLKSPIKHLKTSSNVIRLAVELYTGVMSYAICSSLDVCFVRNADVHGILPNDRTEPKAATLNTRITRITRNGWGINRGTSRVVTTLCLLLFHVRMKWLGW